MRTFTLGAGADRKFVLIEVDGLRVTVTNGKADGSTQRQEKDLRTEAEAQSASEKMARELIARGYAEQSSSGKKKSRPVEAVASATKPASAPKSAAGQRTTSTATPPASRFEQLFGDDDGSAGEASPVLPRLAAAPSAAGAAADSQPKKKKKKSGGKKKRKSAEPGDGLDKKVLAAVAAIGMALVGGLIFFVYDSFLKPSSIVGTWQGSRTEHEISRSLTHSKYRLVLDDQKRVAMTLQDTFTMKGTYTVKGDRLTLNLKDDEGDVSQQEYKIALGSATLDLFDLSSGKKVVQLVRQRESPSAGGSVAPPPAPPKELAAGGGDKIDETADAGLASVAFSPKDGAFRLRHPPGWSAETGSRPDNTYSWARFTKGSAKIQVFADVSGSLMAGPNNSQHEEGSPGAPVESAHRLYKRQANEEFSDYKESEPTLFKGSQLGEGRVSAFTASAGGVFGGKLRGYHVTLLTNNRRVTLLCSCPAAEFEKLKATFLAVSRSLAY